jgi:TonB family protein
LSIISDSVAEVELPSIFAMSMLATKSRAAMIAAGVFALLAISVVIGGFAYNSFLEHQYKTLALAAPTVISPAPPSEIDAEQLQAQDIQNDTPLSLTVTAGAAPDVVAKRESKDPEPPKTQGPPAPVPPPVSQPARVVQSPSPVLPRASFSPDTGVGADSRIPSGVPVEVPIGATQPTEPPAKAVRQSPGVVMGSAIKKVDPVYPSTARSAGQSGAVKVEVSINERGDVISARALSGPALLQGAAISAARAWKFKASTLGGVPVTTTTTIVFNFKL